MKTEIAKSLRRAPHRMLKDRFGNVHRTLCLANDDSFVEHTTKLAADAARKSLPENIRALIDEMKGEADDDQLLELAKQIAALVERPVGGEARVSPPVHRTPPQFGGKGARTLAASHSREVPADSFIKFCESQARLQR